MSAHLPLLHAPRWLRERRHGAQCGHRQSAPRPGRARRATILPVALVAALALGAWSLQIADVAASGASIGVRMLAAGLGPTGDAAVSARVDEDDSAVPDMPAASVDAITL